MSRSRKKGIYKVAGYMKSTYNRVIRRKIRQAVREGKEPPNPKTIINDWDYIDYISRCEFIEKEGNYWKTKFRRK